MGKIGKIGALLLLLSCIIVASVDGQSLRFVQSAETKSKSLQNVVNKYEIFEVQLSDLKKLQNNDGQLDLEILIDNHKSWSLKLSDSGVFGPSTQMRLLGKDADIQIPNLNLSTYHGYLVDNPNSNVAVTLSDGFLSMNISDGKSTYMLEPLTAYDANASTNKFVYYNSKDISESNNYECKKLDVLSEISEQTTSVRSNGVACLDVELAIAVDYQMYVAEGNNANGVINTLASIYNLVSLDYDNEFDDQLNIRIKEVVMASCLACDQWSQNNNVGDALDAIRNWGESGGFNETYDIGIFWTTRVYDDNFAGLAYQDQICGDQRYTAVRKYTNNTQALRIMMSHEIGHLFGCGHNYEIGSMCDGNPGRGPKIMDPIVDAASVGWTNGTQSCDLNSISVVNAKLNTASCIGACGAINCLAITNLNVTNITQNNLSVSWLGSASSYQVRIREEGSNSYLYNSTTSSTSASINTSLEYCKQYHVSVKSLCGGGDNPAAITEIVEISGGTAMEILYVEPLNCNSGAYNLKVIVSYENTAPGGFVVVANGNSQTFSYTSSPQTVTLLGINTSSNSNAVLQAYGTSNSDVACYATINYTEPTNNCDIVIQENFNSCELPYQWVATTSNNTVFSENYEWKFNDETRNINNYGFDLNELTTKTINGTCAAYFDDDIFMNSTYTGNITLESRSYDLTNLSDVFIELDYNFHDFAEGKTNSDASEFSIDIFDGSNWLNVMFDNNDVCPWNNVWQSSCITNFVLDVSSFISDDFRVRLNYTDGNNGDWTGMIMVDNFKVKGVQLSVLDLAILDFNGILQDNVVRLDWRIELDKSFSHYKIERSSDGNDFELIGEVKEGIEFVDKNPLVGDNYYRLHVYDNDGVYVESNIVHVVYSPIESLLLYPNPVNTNQVTLVNTTSINYDQLAVYDIAGRQMDLFQISDSSKLTLDTSDWQEGVYLIQLSNGEVSKTLKLVRL